MVVAIKVFGLAILFLVCVGVGCLKASNLKMRLENLEEIYKGLLELSQRLRYESTQKQRIFNDSFWGAEFLKTDGESLLFSDAALDAEDKRIFSEFYSKFGSADCSAEIDRANLYISIFKQRLDAARENAHILGKIYRTMGVCAGAAGCILLF